MSSVGVKYSTKTKSFRHCCLHDFKFLKIFEIKDKKDKSKTAQGPVHIGSNDQLVLKTDLDSDTFGQCKEKMRAVKKSLKALDKPDPNQTQEEQVRNNRYIYPIQIINLIQF